MKTDHFPCSRAFNYSLIVTRSKAKMAEKLNVNIQNYSGDDSPEWFLDQISELKRLNNWSDEIALLFLKSKLIGNAKAYFQNCPDLKNASYSTAVKNLTNFFASESNPTTSLIMLNNLTLLPGETIKNLSHRLDTLVAKTYSTVTDAKALNQIKSVQLLNALPVKLKEKLILEPLTDYKALVNKAHDIATAEQAMKQAEVHNIMNVAPISDINSIRDQLRLLSNEVTILKSTCSFCNEAHSLAQCQQFKLSLNPKAENVNHIASKSYFQKDKVRCHFCHRTGHFMRECRDYQRSLNNGNRRGNQQNSRHQNPRYQQNYNYGQCAAPPSFVRPSFIPPPNMPQNFNHMQLPFPPNFHVQNQGQFQMHDNNETFPKQHLN